MNNKVFITGGTGYIGNRLIPELIKNNFEVTALVRKGSESKLPNGCKIVYGNALDKTTYENQIHPSDTFIHLIGVSHQDRVRKINSIQFNRSRFNSAGSSCCSCCRYKAFHLFKCRTSGSGNAGFYRCQS